MSNKIIEMEANRQQMEDEMLHQTDELKSKNEILNDEKGSMQETLDELTHVNVELQSKIELENRKFEKEKEAMKTQYELQLNQAKNGVVEALNTNTEENMMLKMQIAKLKAQIEATEMELKKNHENHREMKKKMRKIEQ